MNRREFVAYITRRPGFYVPISVKTKSKSGRDFSSPNMLQCQCTIERDDTARQPYTDISTYTYFKLSNVMSF